MNDMINYFDEDKHEYFIGGKKVPSVTEICSMLSSGKYPAGAAVIEQAKRRGTAIHELCEALDYDEDGIAQIEIEAEAFDYVKAYWSFKRDYQFPEWEYIERPLYSSEGMFAGTVDRIGIIDGRRIIVDLKSTSSMDRVSKLSLACQLQGYYRLAEANGIDINLRDFQNSMGVQLKKDGTYSTFSVKDIEAKYKVDTAELFDTLLEITKLVKGI